MPVPDGGVDQHLPVGERPGDLKGDERGYQRCDAEHEVDGVGDRDEVEEVAAGVGAEEDVLGG